jgi:cytochrome c556
MKFISLIALTACAALAGCGEAEQNNAAAPSANNQSEAAAPAPGATKATAAQSANAAESIRARQSHYKKIGAAMKGINDELKKVAPSTPAIQAHAATIHQFAPQVQGWFPDGSGSDAGVKTEARAEIWSDPEGFKKRTAAFVSAAAAFNQIAQGGDLAAIRTGVKELGGTCKGCHEQFRVDD